MKKSYTDLSKESGIKRGTIWFRVTWKGETKCINEWAEILGVQKATLWWRIKNWSLDRAMETR
jgi:hypothetical protein